MELLSAFTLKVEGVRGFEFCQLSTGGIPLTEIDQQSLESKILPGLFFAGEVLDVHGPCGGYNLQWAFSSGVVVGRHAALARRLIPTFIFSRPTPICLFSAVTTLPQQPIPASLW